MKRHFLTFRRNTHISQKLLENYLEKIMEFLSYNIKLRNKYWFELDAIANMDETPLYLDMPPSTTVQKIESKRVNIKTQRQENWRVTAFLLSLHLEKNYHRCLFLKLKKENKQRKNCKNWRLWRPKKYLFIDKRMHGTAKASCWDG